MKSEVSAAIDEMFMRRCLQLARNGMMGARPNPMVGCVIVAGGRIIGEGYHIRCGEGHAEVNAFASVRQEDEALLPQSTVYVSLEPCAHYGKTPPCCDLIVSKGVKRVVVGCQDSFSKVQGRGVERIREAGIEVTVGVLEQECRALNKRFFTFHEQHRPYIILKWAQTSNGFIDDHGQPLAISTPFTKMLCHRLRAEEDAILVGRVTDEREHPLLNVREWVGKDPLRIVLGNGMDIHHLMDELYRQGIQSLIVEGGRKTLDSFIQARLWDELRVEKAPIAVSDGTPAPLVPPEAYMSGMEKWEGNVIFHYLFNPT
ncbi:MAG: bifunctional diaminohydroxyphosphoribosylaminopyrimidine deaminase/5-amino-6-(5-phosphoribosylamino)uracil reductase RibD [Prevotella sp.]|nr:bifunctional diaminohydroxyphosphoribosylaminopyrimidine deaminase/5-amino-6-(5-phosphoribosylamino)uracil reductase RibD [Prevotella sp.]